MIKSMTGFASLATEDEAATLGVTIRAVNHRFLDVQLRLPAALADAEPQVRAQVQRRLARGRVEVVVAVQLRQTSVASVELNEDVAAALAAAVARARERGLVEGMLTPGDLLRVPQAFTVRERPAEPGGPVAARLEAALDEALDALDAMRVREGEHLRQDLDARRGTLERLIGRLEAAAEQGRAALEARLHERIRDMKLESADPAAIAQEIVRVAVRSDISEEVTRFRAHLVHWSVLVESAEPCGRKLDFLLQEMNREINTIASKADGLGVSELVIHAKAELERMREQVQNVE